MIKLMLKDKIVPGDKTFQSALNDITNTTIGIKVFGHENINENPETQVCSEYDSESKYFYTELANHADFNATKASLMFWRKFPQIVTYLKDMASLINFQPTDGHQIA